ncbi:MAG: hypothetical protein A4E37_00486 [Methanoregulaceae archaeon PtaB.Bin056]|nr:MAG: hypothetical protein A4E37_00486 [Methanoregulaceae archaeon PtaB.Bin056]
MGRVPDEDVVMATGSREMKRKRTGRGGAGVYIAGEMEWYTGNGEG